MLTADVISNNDPAVYAKNMFAKFAEILKIIEEEKAKFSGESLIYFQMFAEKLVENYLENCFDPEQDKNLEERKINLANEQDQMMAHADQLRMFMG